MTETVRFSDTLARDDARVYLQRLQRVGEADTRIVSRGRALALYGCTQPPRGLLAGDPVVLVMRAARLSAESEKHVDAVVPVRALLDRFARLEENERELSLPDARSVAAWAGTLPPAGGWQPQPPLDAASLERVAREGMAQVDAAMPESPGEAVVQRVRADVWNREIAPGIPAAVAFAAETMGFLREERTVRCARSHTWLRLTSSRGHVLVR